MYAKFTEIWWQDVTADGEKELVANALFEDKGYLLIWRWMGGQYTLIANIEGDVIRLNLYGAKLENVDSDPELEILAGDWGHETDEFCFSRDESDGGASICWFEVTRSDILYDWNGAEFRLK